MVAALVNPVDTLRSILQVLEAADATLDWKGRQEIIDKLYDLRCQLGDLSDENRELKAENAKLSEELARRKALEYRGGLYYIIENGALAGPICPDCYDETGRIRLLKNGGSWWRCITCGKRYNDGKPSDGYMLWS